MKSQVNKTVLSVFTTKEKSDSEGSIKPNRETGGYSSSIYTSPITNKISPEGCERPIEDIQPKLRGRNDGVEPSFPGIIRMVAGDPGHEAGKTNKDSIPRSDDELRCSEREKQGMGSPLRGSFNRGGGPWGSEERKEHINILELKAAFLPIKTFLKNSSSESIHLQIDNTVALAHLVKMGRSTAIELIALTSPQN